MSYDLMIYRRYRNDTLLIVSKTENKIVGILEVIKLTHISLLFVDDNFFKNKIATNMFNIMNTMMKSKSYTVNSSEYAINFYEKLGLKKISVSPECKNGVIIYPMIY